jgi:hypothetical protein
LTHGRGGSAAKFLVVARKQQVSGCVLSAPSLPVAVFPPI